MRTPFFFSPATESSAGSFLVAVAGWLKSRWRHWLADHSHWKAISAESDHALALSKWPEGIEALEWIAELRVVSLRMNLAAAH